jgi:hypothetical protein
VALERTLVQIRERSFLDLLDLGLVVIRRRPLVLGITAAAGIAPFAVLNAWLLSSADFPGLLMVPLVVLEIPWATAPLTIVFGGIMFGDRPSVGRIVKTLARSFGKMLVFQGLLRGLLLLFTIFSLLIPARYAFLNEVILLEQGRWGDVDKRSRALCGDHGADLLMRTLMHALFGSLFIGGFYLALRVSQYILIGGSVWNESPDWFDWRVQLGFWIAVMFFAIVRFLTYVDQRIRLEGWEVELRLRTAGSLLEGAEAW